MSKHMKLCLSLSSMLLNHFMTDDVFFHWLIFVAATTFLLILSRICLLILPISDLVGLISLQVGLFAKFGLWSFRVINASFFAVMSTRSLMPSFTVIFLLDFLVGSFVLYRCELSCKILWCFVRGVRCTFVVLIYKNSWFYQQGWEVY